MSGGFFRGTSADQDTRFSNKQAKLLKSQKFAPELEHLVDMTKVKMDVIRPWIATRVTELLGFEDEVLINFIYGLLDGKDVNGKQVQISVTGFMEKNAGKFMKELWTLLLSAQKNASGVPQQFLDAKEEETKKKKAEADRIAGEIKRMKEKEVRELEQEKTRKMDGGFDDLINDAGIERNFKNDVAAGCCSHDRKQLNERNGLIRHRISRSPLSSDHSHSPYRSRHSRSISKSVSRSCSRGGKPRSISRSISPRRHSVSPERVYNSPGRRSPSPRRRNPGRVSVSPLGQRSSHSRRRSISPEDCRSPSSMRFRKYSPLRRRSPSPVGRRRWSPLRHGSPSSRRRSPSPVRHRSPLRRRASPSPARHRSPSPGRHRSPSSPRQRRSISPRRRRPPSPPSPRQRRSISPRRRRSPSPPSPRRRRSISPRRRRSPSPPFPRRRRSISPRRRRSRSPPSRRRRSISPRRRRSPSPPSPRRRRSISPRRRRSPSPPSPRRRRSISPRRHRSPSPAHRRSPSPARRHHRRSPPRRRSPAPPRRRSPSPIRHRSSPRGHRRSSPLSMHRSPSPHEWSSSSRSPSLVRGKSPGQSRRSPIQSPVERIRTGERKSPAHDVPQREKVELLDTARRGQDSTAQRPPISTRSPQRDPKDRTADCKRLPSFSLSPANSPAVSHSPRRNGSPSQDSSYGSPVRRSNDQWTRKDSPTSPQRLKERRVRHGSSGTSGDEEMNHARDDPDRMSKSLRKRSAHPAAVQQNDYPIKTSWRDNNSPERLPTRRSAGDVGSKKKDHELKGGIASERVSHAKDTQEKLSSSNINSRSGQKQQEAYSGEGIEANDKNHPPQSDVKGGNRPHKSETLRNSTKRENQNSRSNLDSSSEESYERRAEVNEKRKHKRSRRKETSSDDDDNSYDSCREERKEAKRRRKEEKRLRKEERRRRREERRRKKEERRASKLKMKSPDSNSPSLDFDRNQDDYASEGERCPTDTETTESERKKLELELREKALESLRAKRGVGH